VKIDRAELLTVLESIQPGLTLRDVVEQSSCFAFQDGQVMTFNDEVACRRKSPLKINGAVPAAPLLAILRKLPEEFVDINLEDGELVIRGKGRKTGLRTQAEVTLPMEKVEEADEWHKLHDDFSDAIFVVSQCVDKDESNYMGSCIHIHPKHIESCDNSQAIRYVLKTRVKEPMLVRGSSIKHIVDLSMTEFCETETWIHFRNPDGLIYSCRRDPQEYEPLDETLAVDGAELTLPKGLGEAAEIAEVFSAENKDENEVTVEIRPGRLRVIGDGISGWATVVKKLKYRGKPMNFRVGPKLLVELVKRYNDCQITPDRLKVDSGKFVYVVALGSPEKEKSKDAED
jgi:hypothetical protein